jgi:RNA polymerase sigma-70 factor (ECF subfamily)
MGSEKEFQNNFEHIYLTYYMGMVRFASEYVIAKEDAENIVHDTFTELWSMKENYIYRMDYMLAFLFKSIKNKCIDYLRHQIVVREAEDKMQKEFRLNMQLKFDSLEAFDENILSSEKTVEELVTNAIQSLPEKCREIFIKSKIEGKKQQQIAMELNISIHTVEAQMKIAYKKLKQELKDYFPLFLFLLHI